MDLRIIDTGLTGWQQAVQSLPPQFVMVGGPLIPGRYKAVKAAASGRALFSFTASLPSGDEGVHAWRFFASPEDQIKALLDGASSLGITSFGVFSPGDSYSKRMGGLFMQEAAARGYSVTSGSYTAGKMNAWPKEAGAFVKTQVGSQRGSIPVATADFQAIFLPDKLEEHGHARLQPALQRRAEPAHDGNLYLGTEPRPHQPQQRRHLRPHHLPPACGTTDFPAPASSAFRNAMAAKNQRTDDWSALGFDFVRFAAALNLQPGWTPRSAQPRPGLRALPWTGLPRPCAGTPRARQVVSFSCSSLRPPDTFRPTCRRSETASLPATSPFPNPPRLPLLSGP